MFDCEGGKGGSGVGTEALPMSPPSGGMGAMSPDNLEPLMTPEPETAGAEDATSPSRPALINTFHLVGLPGFRTLRR